MPLRTRGLIIREMSTGENDRLVTVLTASNGVVRAFCHGAKRMKSRFTGAAHLFAYSDFQISETKTAYIINHAEPIEIFYNLRNDIHKLALAQYFGQLEEELAPANDNAEEYLRLILNSLYLLCNNKRPDDQLKAAFELRLLCLAGYMPNLVACRQCGIFEDKEMYFSVSSGNLTCSSCPREPNAVRIPMGIVTALRHICYADHDKLFNFTISADGFRILSKITEDYLLSKTQRSYKTLDFYHMI